MGVFIASFLGAITETLFMLLTRGELQNRSGLIYGQFSLVWGLGAVLFTVCFHRLTGRRDLVIFLAGTVLGGDLRIPVLLGPGGAVRSLLLGLQPSPSTSTAG
ncbi:MAG: putative ABC transporter permease [Intestinimonas sp.]